MTELPRVCEDCGHMFAERYGRWFPIGNTTTTWLCHHCADVRREQRI